MADKESKDPFKKLIARDDVLEAYTFDSYGVPIRSTLPNMKITQKYACLAHALVYKAKLFLKTHNPKQEILQITIRLKDIEILVHSNKDFSMVTFRSLRSGNPEENEFKQEFPLEYLEDSTDDEFGKPKKWYKRKPKKKAKAKTETNEADKKPEEAAAS